LSGDDALIVWLKSLGLDEYRALLAARPDAVRAWYLRSQLKRHQQGTIDWGTIHAQGVPDGAEPEPHEIAGHLLAGSSVVQAVQQLSTPQLQVFEGVQVLGDGCRRRDLAALMDIPDADAAARLDQVLDELAMVALVWPDGDRLRIGREALELETRLGGPLAAGLPLDVLLADLPSGAMSTIALNLGLNLGDAGDRHQLVALLSRTLRDRDFVRSVAAEAPAETSAILTRLASFGMPGSPGTAHEAVDRRAIEWAAERGLVIMAGYQMAMPREVRLALRGADYRAPFHPAPPVPVTADADPRPTEAANAATRAVEHTEAILHACAATPLTALKSGGVGVRELRRLAKTIGCTVPTLRLLLETACEAKLIAWENGTALPTEAFDSWLAGSPVDRLGALLGAWWRLERLPLLQSPGETKPEPCLDPERAEPYAPSLRAALIRAAATIPPGRAVVGSDALVEGMLWWLPMTFEDPADAADYAATVWEEASSLGVIADGAPSPLARGLVDGRVASSMEELFAGEETAALFQNDLTAVVTGLPSLAMSELFDTVADREARGAASIWRFSPDSVRRGFDQGLSAQAITGELTALSRAGELPNVLTHLIDDVARRHGEVRVVAAGCCLRTPQPSLAEELVRARGLSKLRLREIAPGVLVSALGPAETLKLLRHAGYVPAADAQDGAPFVDRSGRRAKRG
jgi:hypothetical protein